MTVIDASVWVSRFVAEDKFHEASRLWLEKTAGAGLLLIAPTSMLAEVAGAIARHTGSSQLGYQIAQHIRQVPSLTLVTISAELGEFAAEVASTYRLRGGDALYVAVASQLQVPLVSWDQEQIARVAGFISVSSPEH